MRSMETDSKIKVVNFKASRIYRGTTKSRFTHSTARCKI